MGIDVPGIGAGTLLFMSAKSQQLQIRVTPEEKRTLKRLAREAGQGVSSYVLSRAMPQTATRFAEILERLAQGEDSRFALAELNDLLSDLAPAQFSRAVGDAPLLRRASRFHQNYVAAMVELAAERKQVPPPHWTRDVSPLEAPHFAVPMMSLRLHLLRASPTAFKRRNIFIDSSLGDRV